MDGGLGHFWINADVFGKGQVTSIGGSRASTQRFKAQTIVVHPSMIEVESTLVTSASAYFLGNALLAWADFDTFEQEVTFDAANHVIGAAIHLKPTPDLQVSLSPSTDFRLSGHWSFRDDEDLRHVVETALEVEVKSRRPTPFRRLLGPLLRCQDLLSLAFLGFVRADAGRATCIGLEERGHLWNALLMPDPVPPQLQIAALNARPSFHLSHLGGVEALARWVRLSERHPRAVSPVVNRFRRGPTNDEIRLLELAAAIEYWVAAHRRRGAWTRRGANFAEALGHHVGSAFTAWVGDVRKWAEKLWFYYNSLKHDPSYVPDPFAVRTLQESAGLALMSELLNRVAGNKKPARRIFSDYRNQQVKSWVHEVLSA
jgi:hypothetical protein